MANSLNYLINAPARIQTRDLWLWYHTELHAPTGSTQKFKLIGNGEEFTYTPTYASIFIGRWYISNSSYFTRHK
jgi:hypothetical protein